MRRKIESRTATVDIAAEATLELIEDVIGMMDEGQFDYPEGTQVAKGAINERAVTAHLQTVHGWPQTDASAIYVAASNARFRRKHTKSEGHRKLIEAGQCCYDLQAEQEVKDQQESAKTGSNVPGNHFSF